ncbi:MAG TPA: AAA family ATPase [Sphingobium sp.]|uniref:ParA family protein n=1 Tax=Sphingobium sp. TaxID=1912891 RepID=UPI002ED61819
MATVAIFNGKGGVGKTTIALNLAGQAASAGYRVLLWEIDGQGDSSWLVRADLSGKETDLSRLLNNIVDVNDLILPTRVERLSLLPADANARNADNLFIGLMRQQRLLPLFTQLQRRFDVILFDCPPGFCDANLKLLQAVNMVVVPCLPSPLAMRGLLRVRDFVMKARGTHAPILPVFSMVDRRRRMHTIALAEHPEWPVIPYLSEIERMLVERAPLSVFAPGSAAAQLFDRLWSGIEGKLRQSHLIRIRPDATQTAEIVPLPVVKKAAEARVRRTGAFASVRRIYARA